MEMVITHVGEATGSWTCCFAGVGDLSPPVGRRFGLGEKKNCITNRGVCWGLRCRCPLAHTDDCLAGSATASYQSFCVSLLTPIYKHHCGQRRRTPHNLPLPPATRTTRDARSAFSTLGHTNLAIFSQSCIFPPLQPFPITFLPFLGIMCDIFPIFFP